MGTHAVVTIEYGQKKKEEENNYSKYNYLISCSENLLEVQAYFLQSFMLNVGKFQNCFCGPEF